jgi:aminoglycoside phosphotransferase (APT) family kinase protein
MLTAYDASPAIDALTEALTLVCDEPVEILARRPNYWASTFPSDVVICRSQALGEQPIVCKYESPGAVRAAYGHRAGVAYEAAVYRRILAAAPLSSPRFFGSYRPPGTDHTWLFIEFLGNGAGVDEAERTAEAMRLAAAWAGAFHRVHEHHPGTDAARFLTRYDREYYAQWPLRTLHLAGLWHRRFPWLAALCENAQHALASLVDEAQTVIHGEFTPSNVLIRDGKVCPVDWETAAIAIGEIDLVSLIEKWPDAVAADCELAYRTSRWSAGVPNGYRRRMDLASLYWHFRWLGERQDWLVGDHARARFEDVKRIGVRLGLA